MAICSIRFVQKSSLFLGRGVKGGCPHVDKCRGLVSIWA